MVQNVDPRRSRKRHRLRRTLISLIVLVLGVVAILPNLAGIPPVRGLILSAVNARLAPTRLELDSLGLSWFGPTRATGLVLRDPQGKALVSAAEVDFDRSLLQLLTQDPDRATLTLRGAAIDLERSADGSIDLIRAFEPMLARRPKPTEAPAERGQARPDFTFRIEKGSLRFATPELAEPVAAEQLDLTLRVPAEKEPVSWKVALANPSQGDEAMEVEGRFDHRAPSGTPPELTLALTARRWPVAPVIGGVTARGRLDGPVSARLVGGELTLTGDAKILDLDASGPALAGDRIRLDRVQGAWELASADGGWEIRKLDLTAPLGTLNGAGSLAGGGSLSGRLDARLDLVALAEQAPHALRLREGLVLEKGDLRLRAEIRNEQAGPLLDFELRLSDLNARDGARAVTLRDPATLSAKLPLKAGQGGVGLGSSGAGSVELKAAFLDVKGSGDLNAGGKLSGVIDLGGLQAQLRQLVDFGGLEFAGKARVAAAYQRQPAKVTGQLAVEVQKPRVSGLTASPIERDALRVDFAMVGPNDAAGLAASWHTTWLDVKSDDLTAKLEAARKENDPTLAVKASASGVLALSSVMGQAAGKLAGRWDGKTLALDEAHASFRPPAPAIANIEPGLLRVTAVGVLDPTKGTLDLTPKTRPEDTLLIAPEGLHVSGLKGSAEPLAIEGGFNGDIANVDRAIAGLTQSIPYWYAGISAVRGSARLDRAAGILSFDAKVNTPNLSTPGPNGQGRAVVGEVGIASKGTYAIAADRLELADLTLGSRYGTYKAAGNLVEATGRRMADLNVTATPSWDELKAMALGGMAPEVLVAGEVQPFQVKGPLSGPTGLEIIRGLDTELRVNLGTIRAFGLHTDPMPLVVRCGDRQIRIEPLSTGINGGRLELKPEILLDDPQGPAFRLAKGSEIRDLEIDDEVSRRVLAYFVPVLHNSSQVRGRLTTTLERASFPFAGDPSRSVSAAGNLVFKDLIYGPGTFGQQLAAITGRSKATSIKLNQTIAFEVLNGRVKQEGLKIPIAPGAQVELAGSVGFDSTLQLRAQVPITRAMLGVKGQAGGERVGDTKIDVPIGGTLSKPSIERRALQVGLREAGRALVRSGASAEAAELINRIPLPAGSDSDAIKNELQNLFKKPKR